MTVAAATTAGLSMAATEIGELMGDAALTLSTQGLDLTPFVTEFERLNRIAEGSFGVVSRARDLRTGDIVALKRVKLDPRAVDVVGFPVSCLREINVLLRLRHRNIIRVREMVIGKKTDEVYMVMDYLAHDVKHLMHIRRTPFTQSEAKCLIQQLLEATAYMHSHFFVHRDIKTSNLLYDNKGHLAVCDFGLARSFGLPARAYTPPHLVVTRWYRAPELLFGSNVYATPVDVWSCGCVMAELLTGKPLLRGKTDAQQLQLILEMLGTPTDESWPEWRSLPQAARVKQFPGGRLRQTLNLPSHSTAGLPYLSETGLDLLAKLLELNPAKRISAAEALEHPFFAEKPLAQSPERMPTFAETNDHDHDVKRKTPEEEWRGLFSSMAGGFQR